jgi:hypothetical protein
MKGARMAIREENANVVEAIALLGHARWCRCVGVRLTKAEGETVAPTDDQGCQLCHA